MKVKVKLYLRMIKVLRKNVGLKRVLQSSKEQNEIVFKLLSLSYLNVLF